MLRAAVLIIPAALVVACERPTTVTSPDVPDGTALDRGCWTMAIDGDEPRTALIRLIDAKVFPNSPLLSVRPSPPSGDRMLQGTWRYGPTTDSMYVSLGSFSDRGYGMWLRRLNTFAADSLQWMGGVRVFAGPGRAWTTSVRLTRSDCRD